jgi:cytidine deaminase
MAAIETAGVQGGDELLAIASDRIRRRAVSGRHHVACALMTSTGAIFEGLHLSARTGVGSICAEAVAIGQSQILGTTSVARIVSVRATFQQPGETEVVPPCGACRERILDFGPEALVLTPLRDELRWTPIQALLPTPFRRNRCR